MHDSQGIETDHKRDLKKMTQFKVNAFIKLAKNSIMSPSPQKNTENNYLRLLEQDSLSFIRTYKF